MKLQTIAAVLFSVFMLTACDEGPAERMGENIDNAVNDAGNAIEDACEDVRDAVNAADRNC